MTLSQTEERKPLKYRGAESLMMVGAEHVRIDWPLYCLNCILHIDDAPAIRVRVSIA